ncbi:DUF5643 domain-containing protein [Clostridium sp.]|uniref:DUF5643 domain-containing protein n=1 Tax=Clostridium sp. TaxID=1506 RepID=UPI003F36A52D
MSKFDDIKIPENIDEVTKMAINRGKNKKNKYKKVNKVASILVIGGISTIVTFPIVVKALPHIESVINNFIENAIPQAHIEKLKDENNSNNIVVKDKNGILTLESSALDSQTFIANITIESEFLKQYDENDLKYSLYTDTTVSIGDKENLVGGGPDVIKKIGDNKASLIISAYVGDTEINDTTKVYININELEISSNEWRSNYKKELKGNWIFSIDVEKEESIQKIEVNDNIYIDSKVMTFESLEITPFAAYIKLTYDETLDNKWHFGSYKIVDNNGKEYRYSLIDGHTDESKKWNTKLAIYDDLSNIESLSITPYTETAFIESKILNQDTVKMVTTMEANSEIEDKIFSRNVEKRDLEVDTKPAHKYEGKKISYHLDIDKEMKFYTIEELIDKEIQTGGQTSVVVKDIKTNDRNTIVTLKINGDYRNLSQIVLFDEDMRDIYSGIYVTHKGKLPSNGHWNNVKDEHYSSGLATFIIDNIDINKKYKVAVPLKKDIDLNTNYTMNAKIK